MCGQTQKTRPGEPGHRHISTIRPYIVQAFSSVHGTTTSSQLHLRYSTVYLIGSSVHGALVDEAEAGGGVAGGDEDGGEDERREHDAQAPGRVRARVGVGVRVLANPYPNPTNPNPNPTPNPNASPSPNQKGLCSGLSSRWS